MIYILLSIKTRIETDAKSTLGINFAEFISYYPLKQGLKHDFRQNYPLELYIYILLSIKTRIETRRNNDSISKSRKDLYPTIH